MCSRRLDGLIVSPYFGDGEVRNHIEKHDVSGISQLDRYPVCDIPKIQRGPVSRSATSRYGKESNDNDVATFNE